METRPKRRVHKARTLAMEQALRHRERMESRQLAKAFKLIRKWERKLQRIEENKNHPDYVPNQRRRRSKYYEVRSYPAENNPRTPRDGLSDVIEALKCKIQRALKRYALTSRSHTTFSMRCSKSEFLDLFKGFSDIYGEERLRTFLTGNNRGEVLQKLSEVLGLSAQDRNWIARRYYGRDLDVTRDCSYIALDVKDKPRSSIQFDWRQEVCFQLDHAGTERICKFPKLLMKFPRNVTAIRPKHKK